MEFLTSKDVAQRLKISVRSAQRLMKRLPHIRVGSGSQRECLRITDKVLEQYSTTLDNITSCSNSSITKQRNRIIHHKTINKMARR